MNLILTQWPSLQILCKLGSEYVVTCLTELSSSDLDPVTGSVSAAGNTNLVTSQRERGGGGGGSD